MDPATIAALANAAGGLLNAFGNKGGGQSLKKISNYTPGQDQLLSQINQYLTSGGQEGMQKAMQLLQSYMDPNSQANQDYEEPYMRAFNEETLPGIAEQFAGGAGGGALSSSGFGQALGSAGAGLQSNLASQKRDRMRQSLMDFLGQYNQQSGQTLNARPFSYLRKDSGGPAGNPIGGLLSNMTPGMVKGGMSLFGGGSSSSMGGPQSLGNDAISQILGGR